MQCHSFSLLFIGAHLLKWFISTFLFNFLETVLLGFNMDSSLVLKSTMSGLPSIITFIFSSWANGYMIGYGDQYKRASVTPGLQSDRVTALNIFEPVN